MTDNNVAWRKDPLRDLLKDDLIHGKIPPNMKAAEAQLIREEYVKMEGLFAGRLKGMRSIIGREAESKSKEPRWDKKNPVYQQMKDDVDAGSGLTEVEIPGSIPIPDSMGWAVAHELRPEYKDMSEASFKSRLVGMQKIVKKAVTRAQEDAEALARDRKRHPRPKYNHRGEVQWVDSDAKLLLAAEIDAGKHLEMKPAELHASSELYKQQCPLLSMFCRHIDQELQTRKWREQWTDGKKEYAIVTPPWESNDQD
eukprot:scaffold3912_cov136-Amphora_coffeaeformis.AAC.6